MRRSRIAQYILLFLAVTAAGQRVHAESPAVLLPYTEHHDLSYFLTSDGSRREIRSIGQWGERRRHIVAGMEAAMGPFPNQSREVPLKMTVLEEKVTDTFIRRKVSYQSGRPGHRVCAWLQIPKNGLPGPCPAVLCLHPTTPSGKDSTVGISDRASIHYALELVKRGFVTISPDYPSFGEHEYDFAADDYVSGSMKAIVDNSRAIDLLISLPDVDPERIGCIGHSLGGHNGLFTAVFEPRIKAVVSCCGFTSFHKYKGGELRGWAGPCYMPRIEQVYHLSPDRMPFDFAEVLAAIAPRALFVVAPTGDEDFDVAGVRDAIAAANLIYALHGAAGRLQVIYPDGPHDFPRAAREQAYQFLQDQLAGTIGANAPRLSRVPPLTPKQAMDAFEVVEGFQIELVAAEPRVVDPVAMAFDEDARLYVVEMRDYSELDQAHLGRVRFLEDKDGNGTYETSSIFVEGLSWPTAIACFDGGVFVGAAPDILYYKDTNGDGVADHKRVVFTGFGRSNVQGLLNGFQWGLDHRVHGATSSSGASVRVPGSSSAPIELRGRDFAFDPLTLELVTETGGGQHGLTFNRWGDKFVCSNSDHLQAIVFEDRYLSRNPFQSVPAPRRSIATDGPQAAVYRISPVEQWRVARTKMRVAGLASGPIEGGGTAAGYFTSATGVTIYEGNLWPEPYRGWAIVADVGSNLIHRKRMVPHGVSYRGERVDPGTEFVRSRDIWFRPVQMTHGPDGALYVADMYREVIEHPASLPPELKSQLDLNSGNDRGRIYRIVPTGYQFTAPMRFSSISQQQLVEALDHRDIWRRTTAARLIYERQDPSFAPLLKGALKQAALPEGKIAILHSLAGLRQLDAADLEVAISDSHPQVRRHAIILSEHLLKEAPSLRKKITTCVTDKSTVVRFQCALTLGEMDPSDAAPALAALIRDSAASADISSAVLTSIIGSAGDVLENLARDEDWFQSLRSSRIVQSMIGQIMHQSREDDLAVLAKLLEKAVIEDDTAALRVLVESLHRSRGARAGVSSTRARIESLQAKGTEKLVQAAMATCDDPRSSLENRIAAVETLRFGNFATLSGYFDRLLDPTEPPGIQSAVLRSCAATDDPKAAELILSHWENFAPTIRSDAIDTLLQREGNTLALLRTLKDNGQPLTALNLSQLAKLRNYPSQRVRDQLAMLQSTSGEDDRRLVFQQFQSAAAGKGDAAHGRELFLQYCATCHELDSAGHAVGPNLAAMANRGPESILFNVLVPNGEVDPRYLDYIASTVDGEVITGMIGAETTTSITLVGADGKSRVILRTELEAFRSSGKSLMPDGFERVIDKDAMGDLVAYLLQQVSMEPKKP